MWYFRDRSLGRFRAPGWCPDWVLMFLRMFWHDIRSPRAFAGSWVAIARPEEHPRGPRGLQQRLAAWSPNLENQAKTRKIIKIHGKSWNSLIKSVFANSRECSSWEISEKCNTSRINILESISSVFVDWLVYDHFCKGHYLWPQASLRSLTSGQGRWSGGFPLGIPIPSNTVP